MDLVGRQRPRNSECPRCSAVVPGPDKEATSDMYAGGPRGAARDLGDLQQAVDVPTCPGLSGAMRAEVPIVETVHA